MKNIIQKPQKSLNIVDDDSVRFGRKLARFEKIEDGLPSTGYR